MTNIWEGKRVRLRAIEPGDWEIHYEWDQDSEAARSVDHVWFPNSAERARKWAQEQAAKDPQGDHFQFQIETLAGEHVGTINSQHCDPRCGTFSYGIAVMAKHQRKGYASEAILLVLRNFFLERRYQKVTPHVYSFNEASIRLHERLGFQLEGRLRRMVYTNGQFYDLLYYGMTAEEFTEKHLPNM